jgi:hypothetical protein
MANMKLFVQEVHLKKFKEAREGLETSHHQFAHMGLLYDIHN